MVFLLALAEDACERVVVVESVVEPLAQRIFVCKLLGNVACVCPRGLVGGIVFRPRGAWFVDGVAAAVRREQPGCLLSVVPRVLLLLMSG